jgi:hypothetical protein
MDLRAYIGAVLDGAKTWTAALLRAARPLCEAISRAAWDTWEHVGLDVVTALLSALVAWLVVGLKTGKWGLATVVAVFAAGVPLVIFFVFHLIQNALYPARHPFWTVNPGYVGQSEARPSLNLGITPKYLMTGAHFPCFCQVTNPRGDRFHSTAGEQMLISPAVSKMRHH